MEADMNLRHTPRLYVDAALARDSVLQPDSEQTHYLLHVLRLKLGDVARLFNARDGEWKATVTQISKRSITLSLQEQTRQQRTEPDLWLCAAPIKKAHFDFMIEKATELGVTVLQPILTARTQIRGVNLDRCRALAIEAAEQSERLAIPEIRKPVNLDKLIAGWPADRRPIVCAEWGDAMPVGLALNEMICRKRGAIPLPLAGGVRGGLVEQSASFTSPPPSPPASGRGALTATAILAGPEGGLAAEELEKLRALPGAVFIRLGPRILRADTAAISALACWQALQGDWRE
jgi:16S rRNA (uracil1498-N3)-methyltransferase